MRAKIFCGFYDIFDAAIFAVIFLKANFRFFDAAIVVLIFL
jgi:hypothetical protein